MAAAMRWVWAATLGLAGAAMAQEALRGEALVAAFAARTIVVEGVTMGFRQDGTLLVETESGLAQWGSWRALGDRLCWQAGGPEDCVTVRVDRAHLWLTGPGGVREGVYVDL